MAESTFVLKLYFILWAPRLYIEGCPWENIWGKIYTVSVLGFERECQGPHTWNVTLGAAGALAGVGAPLAWDSRYYCIQGWIMSVHG